MEQADLEQLAQVVREMSEHAIDRLFTPEEK